MSELTLGEPEARELSPEEREERAAKAFEIEARIKKNIADSRHDLWDLARNLYEFDEESGWSSLGYETQAEWLAQPEIGLSRRQFFRMTRMWRELVVYREIPVTRLAELDHSKIGIVMPAIENAGKGNKLKIENVLDDVETLGARDLRERYVQAPKPPAKSSSNGDGDDKTITLDGEPVQASVGRSEAKNGSEPPTEKEIEKFQHAALAVDSFLELGGDRRKAKRQWELLVENHPIFKALAELNHFFMEGGKNREAAHDAWLSLASTFSVEP